MTNCIANVVFPVPGVSFKQVHLSRGKPARKNIVQSGYACIYPWLYSLTFHAFHQVRSYNQERSSTTL